ncbi:MAG: hypothetical protein ACREUW_17910 [Burkholderiales bacterium]
MRPVLQRALAAAAGFLAGYIGIVVVFFGVVMGGQALSDSLAPGWLESLAMMGYLVVLHGVMSGCTYAGLAALSKHWRLRRPWSIVRWSAFAGVVGCAFYWTGLIQMLSLSSVLGVQAAGWIATLLPGVVAGLIVIVWAALPGTPAPGAQPR